MALLYIAVLLAFVVGTILYLNTVRAFLTRLKEHHYEKFVALGMPYLGFQLGDRSYREAMRYIRSKRFFELEDTQLETLYKKMVLIERFGIALFALLLLLVGIDS